MEKLEKISAKINSISDPALRDSCKEILCSKKFFHWPASLSFHHAYVGGLVTHTLEVGDLAESIANSGLVKEINKDVLIASYLWHDFLKIEEYILVDTVDTKQRFLPICENEYVGFLTKREGKDSTHAHIKDGAAKFVETAKHYGVESSLIGQVEHCILSHHGFIKDWGSEVPPKTLEALILHQADMLSAHGGKTK